jgi:ribulose kinase
VSIFDFLNTQLQQIQKDTNAPNISYLGRYFFFYGDFFGNRSPIGDPMMSGSVVGITGDKGLRSLAIHYYGTLEFIALQTHQIISKMNNAGHSIASIFMSGSQCQNELLVSLIATACNVPVITPRYPHSAVCHGAAMLAAKAATTDRDGSTEDMWSVMKRLSKPARLFAPINDEGMKKLLAVKYQVFLEQCERQRAFRSMVDQALNNLSFQ